MTAAPQPKPTTTPSSRVRRVARPLLALAAVAAPALYVASVDPNVPGHYPVCPVLAATGWWCPGCGGLRAVHALAHGDLVTAAHDNLLAVALVLAAGLLWAGWTWAALTGGRPPRARLDAGRVVLMVLVLVVFTVYRNLPVGAALAPPVV
ncbi:DUF2752 domain-containing protein [Kitasatospora sp. NPDC096147]|uniref:DUF2752 domain-containing protein n=1 Tax=Kitasatospora sp. NPDC096147 TaxID=3364093 RepID=UPI00380292BB